MMIFRDLLNRANGGIGASYTDTGAATNITSNQITFTASPHTFYYDVATLPWHPPKAKRRTSASSTMDA